MNKAEVNEAEVRVIADTLAMHFIAGDRLAMPKQCACGVLADGFMSHRQHQAEVVLAALRTAVLARP